MIGQRNNILKDVTNKLVKQINETGIYPPTFGVEYEIYKRLMSIAKDPKRPLTIGIDGNIIIVDLIN